MQKSGKDSIGSESLYIPSKVVHRPFVSKVFGVRDPPCPSCHNGLEFQIFENYNDSGMSYIQWRCKNRCGYFQNSELL